MARVIIIMKKFISVLQKTTRKTAVGLVVLGLIVVAAPMAVLATSSNSNESHDSKKVEICHNGHILSVNANGLNGHTPERHPSDFLITSENRESCTSDTQTVTPGTLHITKVIVGNSGAHPESFSFQINEGALTTFSPTGTNDVSENPGTYSVVEPVVANYTTTYTSSDSEHTADCLNLPLSEAGDVTCTVTNTYHAPETPKTCVFGSDATTLVGTAAAVPSFVHPNWTPALVSASPLTQWIWNAFHATPSNTTDEIVTFTKKFNVVGSPSSVQLDLAADNYYSVSVNGTPSCADQTNLDNFSTVEPTCDIKSLVHTGVNTLTFVVNNKSGFGTNPESNPGGLIYKVTIDGATCSAVPTEPTFAKVHLYKYLSNGESEAQVPDTFTGPQFPMTATWSALNIGAGSGAYALGYGHGGAAFKWAADTSAMQEPVVHYTSSEVTGGDSPVVASREQCSPGKYFLKGYRSGTSLSAAQGATLTSTAPDYTNFTGDRYVIVVNQACPAAPTTSSVSATKVVCTNEADLPNWGAGGPDITATTATNWVAEHKSCSIVPWDFQWAPSSTGNPGDNTLGTPEGWSAFVSGLATVPANALVWVREKINSDYIPFTGASSSNNVSAEMYCSNDVLNYDNFDFINPVEGGHTYYCVGFNAPKAPKKTTSSSTVVVTGNTSAGENLLGWMFNRDTSTQTPFEFNTGASSIGSGSLFVKPITNTINANNDKFVGELFLLTPVSGLNNISYDFKIGAPDATAKNQFYMNVYANFGESSPTKFYDCRYNVVPTVGSTGGFTTVTFDPTQSYPVTTRSNSPHTCPASPSGMQALSASGTAVVRVVAINVGDTSGSDTGVSGYFDKVITSITTGLNTHTTTYDFEPVDMCTNIQGTQTTVPEGMTVKDGVCSTPVVETPTVTTPTTTGGGRSGSRRGGGGGGSVLGASTGQVLGESCGVYLEKFLRVGSKKNDTDQTKKLQTFLNKWMNSNLPVTGFYGNMSAAAVKAFQAKYASDILTPWKIGAPTGLVYYTTLHKVNELECPEAAGEKPTNLVDWSKNPTVQ